MSGVIDHSYRRVGGTGRGVLLGVFFDFLYRVFTAESTQVVGISDASTAVLRDLAREKRIEFALRSDSNPPRVVAEQYRVITAAGTIAPTVFVIDPNGLIREVGLNLEQFERDLNTSRFTSAVHADMAPAMANRIKFPPTLFINQILFEGLRTAGAISARIDAVLALGQLR